MFASANVRKTTKQILRLIDEGALDPKAVVLACLSYMSESDVADMAHINELIDLDDQDGEIE